MDVTILHDVSLVPYNSFKLEATAALMAFPHNNEGVKKLIQDYNSKKEIIIIGNGSNIIFSKKYYSDKYLFINLKLMDYIEKIDTRTIKIQAGATLSKLAWFAVENSIVNLEFLEDIPGTVGGAVIMNAGTYKNTIGNFLKTVTYLDLETGEIISKKVESSDFAKRWSFWSDRATIILSVTLESRAGNYIDSLKVVLEEKEKRFLKQPRNYPSAGSVFVRPDKDLKELVVWELLDIVGLRGYAINGCRFSEKHPGFIINTGGACYEDIIDLTNLAKKKVLEKFDIELNMEWKIV